MKFFRIAKEGATSDGRTLKREWLEQAAKNYDPKKYGARINCEHIRGYTPDGPFKAYGDVVALKTEEDKDGKLVLLAALDPTEELKAIVKNRQKVYTSIELAPSFADTGKAYLMGLAVTDNPASLGTEMLQFCAQQHEQQKPSPLSNRKQHPDNLFTAAEETALDFSDGKGVRFASGIAKRVRTLLYRQDTAETHLKDHSEDVREALEALAQDNSDLRDQLEQRDGEFSTLKTEIEALTQALDTQPQASYSRRTPATGGNAAVLTDC